MIKRIFVTLFVIFLATACVQDNLEDGSVAGNEVTVSLLKTKSVNTAVEALPGSLLVYLDLQTAIQLEQGVPVPEIDALCKENNARIKRLFKCINVPEDSKLRRWYVLTFPESTPLEAFAASSAELISVQKLQYNTKLRRSYEGEAIAWTPSTKSATADSPFNDPKLVDQWHYINDGDLSIAPTVKVGADVNVKDAWKLTAGDPSIIVAICDEGVKYSHPDLAPNMWVNTAELNGKEGVDDDKNGYIDDVYGYNFLSTYDAETGEGEVAPISWDRHGDRGHGTHVAGTVAAVNNNGLGVCGIAGGSGKNDGVKMMSCQVFSGNSTAGLLQRALAYEYAMNMGAAVLQCSFGTASGYVTSDADYANRNGAEADALDAFINAPLEGNPVSGRFVVFAAGNDGGSLSGYPAAYNKYISVAAFGPDYLPTNYTNYGPGTTICAPGGDISINASASTPERSQVLSTMPKEIIESDYGYMQGTSMACPHVSGVIALGLSYAKKLNKTFTYDDFLALIYSSVNNIDYHIETSKKIISGTEMDLTAYWQNMGSGAIDAWRLLMQIEGTPCAVFEVGKEDNAPLDAYFGGSAINLTYTKVDVSDQAREALGIEGTPYVKYGRLYVKCTKAGSAKLSVTAIAGGNSVAGSGSAVIGGTEFTRELSLMSKVGGVAHNGGWL